jgi:hypothetical protein
MDIPFRGLDSKSLIYSWRSLIPLFCAVAVIVLTPTLAKADFTGPYSLSNFTLTNTNLNPADVIPADGSAVVTPGGGSLILTGSNTGSGLLPGATTYLTIASRGTGTVSFNWSWSSLDIPQFDDGGYILNGVFTKLADTDGASGSTSFPVSLGQVFGFGVQTIDNTGEPGILTISNFSAPVAASAVPEPGTFTIFLLTGTAAALRWRSQNRERNQ